MDLTLIAAVAEDGTIGDEGEMPWHHPEDLARFKRTTMGAPVIMGRRTYETIVDRLGSALPGRTNVVLSGQPAERVVDEAHRPDDGADVHVAGSLEAAVELAAATGSDRAFVIGGRTVYEQFLPRADRLLITEVPGRYDGDTRFPAIDEVRWEEVAREDHGELAFVEYRRRS